MFDNIVNFFKKTNKREALNASSKEAAKERLHLVLMQDRANVSADFLDLMREEIIEVIKKYIDIDESSMDVRLTNQANEDGSQGAPALYANIPIVNIKENSSNVKYENEVNNKIIKSDSIESSKDNKENNTKTNIQEEKTRNSEDKNSLSKNQNFEKKKNKKKNDGNTSKKNNVKKES